MARLPPPSIAQPLTSRSVGGARVVGRRPGLCAGATGAPAGPLCTTQSACPVSEAAAAANGLLAGAPDVRRWSSTPRGTQPTVSVSSRGAAGGEGRATGGGPRGAATPRATRTGTAAATPPRQSSAHGGPRPDVDTTRQCHVSVVGGGAPDNSVGAWAPVVCGQESWRRLGCATVAVPKL